jgi:hypothetical protein
MKYIIGLGCSWTQGEGGYPEEIWKQYNGRVQLRGVDDYCLRHIEHENSWVNVLCRDHFPEYIPINLGARGIGNYAAVHQLHFCDKVDWNNDTGIIILMLSGFERLDLFNQAPTNSDGHDDMYSNNEFRHYKWRTAWPIPFHNTGDSAFWDVYGRELWSEQFVSAWQMMALLDVQAFAKAYGFKLIVANSFNHRNEGIIQYLRNNAASLVDKFDWNNYIHNYTEYTAFVQKLVELDGLIPIQDWTNFHQFYHKRSWPAKYLTNCEGAHPTLEGYKVIAAELAAFIKQRGYVQDQLCKSELPTRP